MVDFLVHLEAGDHLFKYDITESAVSKATFLGVLFPFNNLFGCVFLCHEV